MSNGASRKIMNGEPLEATIEIGKIKVIYHRATFASRQNRLKHVEQFFNAVALPNLVTKAKQQLYQQLENQGVRIL